MKWLFFAVLLLALIFFGSFGFSTTSRQPMWDALCAQYSSSEEDCIAANIDGMSEPEAQPDCEWLADKNDCQCNGTLCDDLDGRLTRPDRPVPPPQSYQPDYSYLPRALCILFFVLTLPGALVGAFFGSASKSLAKKVPNRLARTALLVVGAAIALLLAVLFFSFLSFLFLDGILFSTDLDYLLVTFLPNIAALFACFFICRRQKPLGVLLLQFLLALVILFIAFSAIFLAVGLI